MRCLPASPRPDLCAARQRLTEERDMALTIKKLDKIEKSLEGALDAETFEAASHQIAGVREAINAGETFSTAGDLLGDRFERLGVKGAFERLFDLVELFDG